MVVTVISFPALTGKHDPTGGNPKQVSTGSGGSDGHIISSSYRSSLCIYSKFNLSKILFRILIDNQKKYQYQCASFLCT